jgi:hypothetical protein
LPVLEDLPPFLTVKQAAAALQLGKSTTYQLTVEWDRTRGKSGLPFVCSGAGSASPEPPSSSSSNGSSSREPDYPTVPQPIGGGVGC